MWRSAARPPQLRPAQLRPAQLRPPRLQASPAQASPAQASNDHQAVPPATSFTEEQRGELGGAGQAAPRRKPVCRATPRSAPRWGRSSNGTRWNALARGAGADPADATVPGWDSTPAGPPDTTPASAAATPDPNCRRSPCPGRASRVSFAAHIKPMLPGQGPAVHAIRPRSVVLYDDVPAHAADILGRLDDGTMPATGRGRPRRPRSFRRSTNPARSVRSRPSRYTGYRC